MQINDTLLSGASGFLGKYIYNELQQYGHVITLSRKTSAINVDLSKQIPNLPEVELVVHCAGKAHSVPNTAAEKQAFFDVNLIGASNLLKGLEKNNKLPASLVLISTVAVYGLIIGQMIDESYPLNAQDPYGKSKIEAEILVQDWCANHNVICSILRLPLLVGENPPGNLGAMIKGIKKGYYFNLAADAKKSMVLTTDVAKIIPVVAKIGGIYNLSDGYHPSFKELSNAIAVQLHKRRPKNLPSWLGWLLAYGIDKFSFLLPAYANKFKKLTFSLTFDDSKARKMIGWNPNRVLDNFKIR